MTRGIRSRPPVQAVRDDQGVRHGHRRRTKVRNTWRRLAAGSTCDSAPGVGTCVRARSAGRRQSPAVRQGRGRRMSETRRPLLIVEDDPALQKQMRWAFDKYETVVAANRESAIAQLRRYEPAVVTMDLGLPPHPDDPTEGLQLLEEIHALAPDTKVIVLTGQNDRSNALQAIALGAHDFCTEAVRARTPHLDDRPGVSRARAAGGEPAAASVAAVARDVRDHHPRPGNAAHLPHDRKGGADVGDRADPGRVGHRQGTVRPRRCTICRRGRASASSRSTAPRFPRRCSKANCSATKRARSPAPPSRRSARSRRRTAARCSSTRSATCRFRCRRSCCASCRSA